MLQKGITTIGNQWYFFMDKFQMSDKCLKLPLLLAQNGYVLIKNIINKDLILDVFNGWQKFFKDKAKYYYYSDHIKPAGYYNYWKKSKEFYYIGIPKESFYYFPHIEFIKNHTHIRNATHALYKQFTMISQEIIQSLENEMFENWINNYNKEYSLRIIHSPSSLALKSDRRLEGTKHLRNREHEDIDLITLLPGSSYEGLQILSNGKWVDIKADFGDVIIMSGDILNLLSSGYYKSTTHKVVYKNIHKDRYSMAFFTSLLS
jgi:hypothetical protein